MDDISILTGVTLSDIAVDNRLDVIIFTDSNGCTYKMWHEQDCCESVQIDEIIGDLADLLYSPILLAEAVSNSDHTEDQLYHHDESFTWTFYKLSTIKGSVSIRWFGTSNGYYSERVSFRKIRHDN